MADSDSPTAPAVPPRPDTLGQRLRNARLAHDLTLDQLATELRIEAKQLRALEEDRFEQIGVPVFVKGYLRQYGQRLGLDVRDLLASYYEQTTLTDVEIQPSRTIKLRDERQITSWVLAALVLLTAIVGLAVWWWNGGGFGGVSLIRGASTPPAESEAPPEPALDPVVTPPPPAEPVPLEDAGPAPPEQNAPAAESPVPAVAAVEDAGDEARAAPVVAIPLQFTFDRESWAEVTDARGERLLFGLNAAGRRVTVRGEPPFAVVLGDAGAVQLTVDGEPYAIPTAGRQGNLVRFSVDIAEE